MVMLTSAACACAASPWLSDPCRPDFLHSAQDFMIAAHCFLHEFTDLGWRELSEDGTTDGPRQPGFVWHTEPGCVLLPGDARICFLRCDVAECMLGQARALP